MKILFATSEAFPLVKTGGLGDVSYSLPRVLHEQGIDIKVILPAYRPVLEKISASRIVGWMDVQGSGRTHTVRILEVNDSPLGIPLLLVDSVSLYDRAGGPYQHAGGYDWPDNAERFAVFSQVAARLATGALDLGWKPDVVHCSDWQTGLIPAWLKQYEDAPASVFTIHNLAYSGLFPYSEFTNLGLPSHWWSAEGVEFYGHLSMLKAGIVFSERITTVSPTYAREILTPEFGYGFEGVLRSVQYKLSGILNGVDPDEWNPGTDPHIDAHYSAHKGYIGGKRANKAALLRRMGVHPSGNFLKAPLLGFIGRLVEQKGIDLLLGVLPELIEYSDANFVFLGTGVDYYERALKSLVDKYPSRLMAHLGYSEDLAHLIEAGSDMFIMPSRFEPCGLNQLYSLRYGTIPIVHGTGGLADTVVDANEYEISRQTATGFSFDTPSQDNLRDTIWRALHAYEDRGLWKQLMRTAMNQDYSWTASAAAYAELYAQLKSDS